MSHKPPRGNPDRLDQVVAQARRRREEREQGFRERALKLFPWVCGRCAREFTLFNVQPLSVHHRDGNHDNNPQDGSNGELLCVYCHENEHARVLTTMAGQHPMADSVRRRHTSRSPTWHRR